MRVYVLGAGSSVPYGLPTMRGLLKQVWEISQPQDRKRIEHATYQVLGRDLECEPECDVEELLNRLDSRGLAFLNQPLDGFPTTPEPHPVATMIVRCLCETIRRKCLEAASITGPLDRLIRSLEPGDRIVSFNWDVLFELAVKRTGRRYSYGARMERSQFAHLDADGASTEVPLIKPHGSIAWLPLLEREMLSIDVSAHSNVDVLGADLGNYMLYLRDPLGEVNMGISSPWAKDGLASGPGIVIPHSGKTLNVEGQTHDGFVDAGHRRAMTLVWKDFVDAVNSADEMVFIGYSLPGTDLGAIEVFQRWQSVKGTEGGNRKRLFVIDPNEYVVERFRRLIGPDAIHLQSRFEEFDVTQL